MIKIIKKIVCVLIIMAVFVGAGAIIINLSVTITGRSAQYVGDYDEFYIYKKYTYIKPFIDFGTGGSAGYTVWFLPGQKKKALEKIKEDVKAELKSAMAEYSDILKSYEISDDFKKVYIYYYKDTRLPDGFNPDRSVAPKVELYHQMISGDANIELSSIMNWVEIDESFNP